MNPWIVLPHEDFTKFSAFILADKHEGDRRMMEDEFGDDEQLKIDVSARVYRWEDLDGAQARSRN